MSALIWDCLPSTEIIVRLVCINTEQRVWINELSNLGPYQHINELHIILNNSKFWFSFCISYVQHACETGYLISALFMFDFIPLYIISTYHVSPKKIELFFLNRRYTIITERIFLSWFFACMQSLKSPKFIDINQIKCHCRKSLKYLLPYIEKNEA